MEQLGARHIHFYKKKRTWLSVVLAIAIVWLTGFLFFVHTIPKSKLGLDTDYDAIVVLTGGAGRIEAGLDLLNNGYAEKLMVSGVHRAIDMKEIVRVFRQTPDIADCCLVLGYDASDTIGNAVEIKNWTDNAALASLIVVTSSYHMPRALVEIRHKLPHIKITPYPVFSPNVRIVDWYRWPGSAFLVFGEYNKMLLSLARTGILKLSRD